ncbi:MAG: PAS domain S-box protein, partial [Mariprofundaceae bacterium]
MADFESQAVLIIGAGHGCIEMIKLFQDDSPFHIIGIVDTNPDAPAFKLARQLNIPQFYDVKKALHHCKPCTALNLTLDEKISSTAAEIIGASSIIGGHESALIWKMVNDAKNARDALEKNQRLTESIITHAMEAIIMINSKGILSKFNPAAEQIFGYSKDEVLGNNINMLMPEPDKTSHDGYLQRYLDTH